MKKRIGLITNTLTGGGLERAMVNIANQLSKNNYKVDFLVASNKGELFADLLDSVNVIILKKSSKLSIKFIWTIFLSSRDGYQLYFKNIRYRWPKAMKCIPAIKEYVHKADPDIILSTPMTANVAMILACSKSSNKTRLVVREASTLSMEIKNKVNPVFNNLIKIVPWAYNNAHRVICVSKGVKSDLCDNYLIDESKCEILRNPIDAKELYRLAKEYNPDELLIDIYSPYLLAIGRLEEQKDFGTLIKAFSILEYTIPIKLLILGEGSERKKLENLIDELELSERVIMPGFIKNPYPYLSKCDLFVLSSRWEGLANVLREAMVFGKKIVATDCPSGTREIIENYNSGIIVPVSDYQSMSKAIYNALVSDVNEDANVVIYNSNDYVNMINRLL